MDALTDQLVEATCLTLRPSPPGRVCAGCTCSTSAEISSNLALRWSELTYCPVYRSELTDYLLPRPHVRSHLMPPTPSTDQSSPTASCPVHRSELTYCLLPHPQVRAPLLPGPQVRAHLLPGPQVRAHLLPCLQVISY